MEDFTRLDVADGFDVVVIHDTVESVTIEAPEGWHSRIRTYVSEGTLHINIEDNVFAGSFTPRRAYVHVGHLTGVAASGGSKVSSTDTFSIGTFALRGSGGSSITLRLTAGTLQCDVSGGTSFTVAGSAQSIVVASCSGGSAVHAFDLPTGTAAVDASGGSAVDVRAADELVVTASGGSTVRYKGHPRITQDISIDSRLMDAN